MVDELFIGTAHGAQGIFTGEPMEKTSIAPHHPSPATDGRRCFLCGGRQFELLHAWEVDELRNSALIRVAVWQCNCGIVLLHPVPTAQQLPEQGDWWSTGRARVTRCPRFKRMRRKLRRAVIGSAPYRFIRDTRRAVAAGRLLDIGCGTGTLMQEASPYYQCVGLDPSARAASAAREAGFEVIEVTIEDARIDPESFEVVTMYSVIKHVLDPLHVLKLVHRILTPGGPAYRLHGKEWNGFRVGYHTYLFDGRTLGRTIEQAGFDVLASPKRDRPLDDVLILWGRKPPH